MQLHEPFAGSFIFQDCHSKDYCGMLARHCREEAVEHIHGTGHHRWHVWISGSLIWAFQISSSVSGKGTNFSSLAKGKVYNERYGPGPQQSIRSTVQFTLAIFVSEQKHLQMQSPANKPGACFSGVKNPQQRRVVGDNHERFSF